MGLSDSHVFVSADKMPIWGLEASYTFHYVPEIEQVAARYAKNRFPGELNYGLDISVDDQGIQAVVCEAAYVVQDAQGTAEVELLPFMMIKAVYESAIPEVIGQLEEEYAAQKANSWKGLTSVSVDQVRLVYVMYGSAEDGAGMLTPAWEFYGTITALDEDGEEQANPGYRLLTIDAVTGSPIGI